MSHVLLRGPLLSEFRDQNFSRRPTNQFFQSRRSAAQPRTQVRMQFDGERELKLALKPDRYSIHVNPQRPDKGIDANRSSEDSPISDVRGYASKGEENRGYSLQTVDSATTQQHWPFTHFR